MPKKILRNQIRESGFSKSGPGLDSGLLLRSGLVGWFLFVLTLGPLAAGQFRPDWAQNLSRPWVGPDFYAQRLEDWRLNQGSVECLGAAANRYLYLLTGEVAAGSGLLEISVKVSVPELPARARARNFVALRLGIKSPGGDFREAAVSGQGLEAGVTTDGLLFIGELESVSSEEKQEELKRALRKGLELRLNLGTSDSQSSVRLEVVEPESGEILDELEETRLTGDKIAGGLALVSSLPEVRPGEGMAASRWRDLDISGDLFENHPERALGPVVFTLYTLSRDKLTLTAQLVPGCLTSETRAVLEISEDGRWVQVAAAPVDLNSWLARFRVAGWDSSRDHEFRARLEGQEPGPEFAHNPIGIVRKEPRDQDRLVLAVLSNQQEEGYPHHGLVSVLKKQNPDLLFFAGNQVFGRPASFWREKFTPEEARREYLRQWLLFGWAFSELLRDRPAVVMPDARDFFQAKLWGENGRLIRAEDYPDPVAAQDSGGFLMPPEFIDLVLATQISHLPEVEGHPGSGKDEDPYFREIRYGGLSLAVVCDRVFKSAPAPLLPEAQVRNGWAWNSEFDLKKQGSPKQAQLLGPAQLKLLRKWAEDWSDGVWMKALLTQSLWVSLLTLPEGRLGDEALWQLQPIKPGDYPPDDRPVADFMSGGWPKAARDETIRILRQAFAPHLAGSGGPPAALKYGLGKPGDAGWAFVPPPIVAGPAVRWMPKPATRSLVTKAPEATGDFEDAFGNKFSLEVVTNPLEGETAQAGRGSSGYGLVIFDRNERRVMLDCLVRPENFSEAQYKSYPGWPVSFSQLENDGRKPAAYLPLLQFRGISDPVVQVVDEKSMEVVYTLRIRGAEFRPPVFRAGSYTVRCGEPGTAAWKEIKGVSSLPASVRKNLAIDLGTGRTQVRE
ncbi:MAG: hypothetical protein OP8BY_0071 [Candidatus Saccharicenans subterraneus]|uniref:Uncharacterized protein n=1 Tax=Candidatus Saccharicenans subterraneus TaxID=2508984 RepID=A0A3E2BM60_9BACT|nr:MAG: hypothetical protein OP8BY_0071 [Candidatus Saccharicenans subterraneum]